MFEIATNQTQMWEYGSKTEDKRKSAVLSGEDTKMPQFHLTDVYSMYFLHIPHNTSRRSPRPEHSLQWLFMVLQSYIFVFFSSYLKLGNK